MAISDIQKNTQDFIKRVDEMTDMILGSVGEKFVENARNSVTETIYKRTVYTKKGEARSRRPWELTGNLRNSIGFLIIKNKQITGAKFGSGEGAAKGEQEAKELAKEVENGLVGVAGMDYALFVESKGYDVISNSVNIAIPQYERMMEKFLKELLK